MKRRVIQTVVFALAAVLLAGCSSAIPSSGPVKVGLNDLRQVEQLVQYNPPGPTPGSSQEDVVRGFVNAATSSADDYSIAREYLTRDYASQWNPNDGVIIDDGNRSYHSENDTLGVLSLVMTADVDERGVMLPFASGSSGDVRFELQKVGEEWRISSAPNGIILDGADFLQIWSAHELNFIGAGGYLVPETRWYLTRAALPTEIVNDLVEGPSARMRESVRTAFPPGSALVNGTVPIENGHARVDFTGDLLAVGPETLDEIAGQLGSSLRLVQGVTSFELLVDGASLREESTNARADLRPASESTNTAVVAGDKLGELVVDQFQELTSLSQPVMALDPRAVTLSPDGNSAAVLSAVGVTRVNAAGSSHIDERTGQLQPSYDALGYVWTVRANGPSHIRVTTPNGSAVPVPAPWLDGRKIVALRLSPDGARLAALLADGQDSVVMVAGVIRDEVGVPLRTTDDADEQMWATGTPIDIDWIDQSHFAVLTKATDASKVTIGGPGLFSQGQGSVAGGSQISGGSARAQLRVLGEERGLFASQRSGWQRVADKIELLAKRG